MPDLLKKKKLKNIQTKENSEKIIASEKQMGLIKKIFAKNKRAIIILTIFLVIMLISALPAWYFYDKYKGVLTVIQSQNSQKTEETEQEKLKKIVGAVSEFMDLPENEEPALASITDIEKISNQPFFARAQNGDKILIYTSAKKAILYRPETNRVIEVSNISGTDEKTRNSFDNQEAHQDKPDSQTEENLSREKQVRLPAKVSIYNGANIKDVAQKTEDELAGIEGIEVIEKTNSRARYNKTVVIDLSGRFPEMVAKIISVIKGEIGDLPDNEIKPEADILIIRGRDIVNAGANSADIAN